jgi:hypothetical protein
MPHPSTKNRNFFLHTFDLTPHNTQIILVNFWFAQGIKNLQGQHLPNAGNLGNLRATRFFQALVAAKMLKQTFFSSASNSG